MTTKFTVAICVCLYLSITSLSLAQSDAEQVLSTAEEDYFVHNILLNKKFNPNEVRQIANNFTAAKFDTVYSVLSKCGVNFDFIHPEEYSNEFGIDKALVKAHADATVELIWNSKVVALGEQYKKMVGKHICSAGLLAHNQIMTAAHCFEAEHVPNFPEKNGKPVTKREAAEFMSVRLNRQQVGSTKHVRNGQSVNVRRIEKIRSGKGSSVDDFAIVKIDSVKTVVGNNFSVVNPNSAMLEGRGLLLVHYPIGMPKVLGFTEKYSFNAVDIKHKIDTNYGSSGGPLFQDGRLVGIHTKPGCTQAAAGSNVGLNYKSIERRL